MALHCIMFRKLVLITVFVFLMCASVSAQDWMPDENLREAVRAHLQLADSESLTQQSMESLDELHIQHREISDITGLEFAINLKVLFIFGNPISDLNPIANLQFIVLNAGGCRITDVSPLKNMVTLEHLYLHYNRIHDVTPLLKLINLKELALLGNPISDWTLINQVFNLEWQDWGALCEVPGKPVANRIANKSYPAIFGAWSEILNRPDLSDSNKGALFDLSVRGTFGLLPWTFTEQGWKLSGDIEYATSQREKLLNENPNALVLLSIPYHSARSDTHPLYADFYLRDENGTPLVDQWAIFDLTYESAMTSGEVFGILLDFTNPKLQDFVVQHAIAVAECGLVDGIMFDHWNEGQRLGDHHTRQEEHEARTTILKRIRDAVDDDFLILVNTNWGKIPKWSQYINGAFMELDIGIIDGYDNWSGYTVDELIIFEDVLIWSEQNMRYPQINCLEGWGIATEAPDSENNLRWMRLFTTMSLTHSDGYVIYTEGRSHSAYWYDFWNADLGQPIGEKLQTYNGIDGLFIREFAHGWAVYNRSGQSQNIRFESHVSGKASEFGGTEHTIPDLDGEIYLKSKNSMSTDINGDSIVNVLDLVIVANAFGTKEPDLNGDGVVNILDLVIVANAF